MSKLSSILRSVLRDFELQKALKLSNHIHCMEANGYQTSQIEDYLWEELTLKILTNS